MVKSQQSPFNPCDEKHKVAVDLGTIDESVNVAGVDGLSRLKTGSANAITCCKSNQNNHVKRRKIEYHSNIALLFQVADMLMVDFE